ncbi:unnamed protein product [Spirodela intermedia]|uniref:Uncharacterized protein n=1 Tax=Spirodela intermedia TaxID=51605 RepID=A0A7I8JGI4_SPIIN|nr:unnamed protein product [Spirodela intermedia]CAA6669254.1 unnamed protein product [Spirodela intermedia]
MLINLLVNVPQLHNGGPSSASIQMSLSLHCCSWNYL